MLRAANAWRKVTAQPGRFSLQVLKAFQKNQGLLLSGALAYYILLSIIPLFTFLLLMLSHLVDETALIATLRRYIVLIIPGDSTAVLEQVRNILEQLPDGSCLGRCCSSAPLPSACSRAPYRSFSFTGYGTSKGL